MNATYNLCLNFCLQIFVGLLAAANAAPASMFDDIFSGFITNSKLSAPSKDSQVVKRTIIEHNPDAKLKQISLNALIGDLEQSLFNSALSVSAVVHDKEAVVPEITPSTEHTVAKRHTEGSSTTPKIAEEPTSTTEPMLEGKENIIIQQTTQKVPEQEGVPAHILIDRISVQPHFGGIPLIPAFEVQRPKESIAEQEHAETPDETHITITKTSIKATSVVAKNEQPAKVESSETTSSTTTASTSTEVNTSSSTTKTPIVQLKEAKEELQEKIAEIEAEPVILSARV